MSRKVRVFVWTFSITFLAAAAVWTLANQHTRPVDQGLMAPDFVLTSADGSRVQLSHYRGKAVALNFWATWCIPCRAAMADLIHAQDTHAAEGLQVIGIAMDDDAEGHAGDVASVSKGLHLNYVVLLGNNGVADAYGGVKQLPSTFYIGRDGRIVASTSGIPSNADVESNVRQALMQGVEDRH